MQSDTKPDGTVACEDKQEVMHLSVVNFVRCIVYEMIVYFKTKVIWVQFIQYMLELRAVGAMPNPGFL